MGSFEQIEKNLREISENLLVQTKLMDRLERRVDDFHRETQERFERIEVQADRHSAELTEFRATVVRVLDLMERFVRGRGHSENGSPE